MVRVPKCAEAWRGVCLTLVALALMLKVLVPPGFMFADQGAPLSLVICTGHGPMKVADPTHPAHHGPASNKSDAPCSGAGNVSPTAPPAITAVLEPYAVVAPVVSGTNGVDLVPGRGLAAPPPPSQASPLALI
jgi:hypothetical protein